MKLTAAQIETLAKNVGFAADFAIARAIAQAESSGNPDEYNPEAQFFEERNMSPSAADDRGSYGLWQIFSFEHPEFAGWNLKDPQINACAMAIVYFRAGKSFSPWSTYRSGAYEKFLEASAT